MPLAGGGLGRVALGKGPGRDENKQGLFGKQNGDSGISLRCFPGKTSYLEWPLKGPLPDLPKVFVSGNNTVAISGGQQHLPSSSLSAAQQCRPYPFCPITAAHPPSRLWTYFLASSPYRPAFLGAQTVMLRNARVTFPKLDSHHFTPHAVSKIL